MNETKRTYNKLVTQKLKNLPKFYKNKEEIKQLFRSALIK